MGSWQNSAHQHVEKQLSSSDLYSPHFPNLDRNNLEWEIDRRIENPDRIRPSTSDRCGVATVFDSLAWDDP